MLSIGPLREEGNVLCRAVETARNLAKRDLLIRFVTKQGDKARIDDAPPVRPHDMAEVHPDGVVYFLRFNGHGYHRELVTYDTDRQTLVTYHRA